MEKPGEEADVKFIEITMNDLEYCITTFDKTEMWFERIDSK